MDPDANLKELLELAERAADDAGALCWTDTARMAELVIALDRWIKKGGFLPKVWLEVAHVLPPNIRYCTQCAYQGEKVECPKCSGLTTDTP